MALNSMLSLVFLSLLMVTDVLAVSGHGCRDDFDMETSSFENYNIDKLNRSSFPEDFIFGMAISAYQSEGAWNVDGRGPSIWDHYTHKYPEKIKGRTNGDVAVDFYHRYKKDIQRLKHLNMDSLRLSFSWSRILPNGKINEGVNKEGIKYYNDLIDYLLAKGIIPMVTLSHFDTPLALEEEYGGFLSHKILEDYLDYVDLCFKTFGDRVKYWSTINEPWTFSWSGYDVGVIAPGRCSAWMNKNCTGGDSGTEPYLVAHNQLLCHAHAVDLYRTKYQDQQKGQIGIDLFALGTVPYSKSSVDCRAAVRAFDFNFGWFMDPLVHGDYPASMRTLIGSRLPDFTEKESNLLKGSYDFIGVHYYTAFYVSDAIDNCEGSYMSYSNDSKIILSIERDGKAIGPQGGSAWIHTYPDGMYEILKYIKEKYQDPVIYVSECGIDDISNDNLPLRKKLKDDFRIKFYYIHLLKVLQAIKEGVRVKGFHAWTLMDNFEWVDAYTVRFGVYYVDFQNGLKRYPKLSAKWFKKFLQKKY